MQYDRSSAQGVCTINIRLARCGCDGNQIRFTANILDGGSDPNVPHSFEYLYSRSKGGSTIRINIKYNEVGKARAGDVTQSSDVVINGSTSQDGQTFRIGAREQ